LGQDKTTMFSLKRKLAHLKNQLLMPFVLNRKIKEFIQLRGIRFRKGSLRTIIVFLAPGILAIALFFYSVPKLIEIYGQPVSNNLGNFIALTTGCPKHSSVFVTIDILNETEGKVDISIYQNYQGEDVGLGNKQLHKRELSCSNFTVESNIQLDNLHVYSLHENKEDGSDQQFPLARDLWSLDTEGETHKIQLKKPTNGIGKFYGVAHGLSLRAKSNKLLSHRTYSRTAFGLSVDAATQTIEKQSNGEKVIWKNLREGEIHVTLQLPSQFEIVGTAETEYHYEANATGHSIFFNIENGGGGAYFFLENLVRAQAKDTEVLISGALFSTGIGLVAQVLIAGIGLLKKTGE
jgi:hypothetical protein